MKYMISQLNREVELDDLLVNEYVKYDDLTEYNFVIVLASKFGHLPTKEEISDEELSQICNKVLFGELKALTLLPKALEVISQHREELTEAAKTGTLLQFSLSE